MSEEVLTSEEDGILVVTINRPEAKNAMTKAAAEGIAAAMDRLDSDDSLRVGILTGAGGTFCSGMDLKGFLATCVWPEHRRVGWKVLGSSTVGGSRRS